MTAFQRGVYRGLRRCALPGLAHPQRGIVSLMPWTAGAVTFVFPLRTLDGPPRLRCPIDLA
ncbi:MAG: hypothetical protein ACREYE_33945, partial [Gammaproteobacteria bacterium]